VLDDHGESLLRELLAEKEQRIKELEGRVAGGELIAMKAWADGSTRISLLEEELALWHKADDWPQRVLDLLESREKNDA